MNRLARIVALAFVAVVGFSSTGSAQYVVKIGDTLWDIAEKNNDSALAWLSIYRHSGNPFLREPQRRSVDETGRIIVRIHPGELLQGVNQAGIVQPTPTTMPQLDASHTIIKRVDRFPDWAFLLLILLATVVAGLLLLLISRRRDLREVRDQLHDSREEVYRIQHRRREAEERVDSLQRDIERRGDPTTAGSPMIQGGVNDMSAHGAFAEMAMRAYNQETGRGVTNSALFTVLNSVGGHIWGTMIVSYADGRQVEFILNGQRAYRAEVRFPDGKTETLYMLQACGNDLRFPGPNRVDRYTPSADFRFVPDNGISATPQATAAATVTKVVSATAATRPAVSSTVVAPEEEPMAGAVRLSIKRANQSRPAMVQVTGLDPTVDATMDVTPTSITLRYGGRIEQQ